MIREANLPRPTVKELFRLLKESKAIPESDPTSANLKGQVRRRTRLLRAMGEIIALHYQFHCLDVRSVEEEFRKHSRFIRKALDAKHA
jgi:hypothetical protein